MQRLEAKAQASGHVQEGNFMSKREIRSGNHRKMNKKDEKKLTLVLTPNNGQERNSTSQVSKRKSHVSPNKSNTVQLFLLFTFATRSLDWLVK